MPGSSSGMWVTPNCMMIECILQPSSGSTKTQNPFGQQQQLNNKKIVAIETFSGQDCTYSPISTSNPVVTQSIFNVSFLTLYRASVPAFHGSAGSFPASNEGLYYDKIPLSRMRMVGNNDTTPTNVTSNNQSSMFRIKPAEMSWAKCFVFCCQTAFPPNIPAYSSIFMVHYLNQEEDWTPYM